MIALPWLAPALNDTTSGPVALVVEPGTALTCLGAPGGVPGVTLADSADCDPVPTEFTAATLNLYWVPLVRPENVKAVAAEPTRRDVEPVTPEAPPPELL